MTLHFTFVVVGGGISGVSCVETLALLNENARILLITTSEIVKTASSAIHITKTIVELNVEEVNSNTIKNKHSNVSILTDVVNGLNYDGKFVETEKSGRVYFEKLCICTGGRPNMISDSSPFVLGIRDTKSVREFQKRIESAKKVLIVGNGGIASEIVYEMTGVDKVWVMKDDHISKTFVDAGAGEFFRDNLEKRDCGETVIKRVKYTAEETKSGCQSINNPALGPDWHLKFHLHGNLRTNELIMEFGTEIAKIVPGDDRVCVKLTNSHEYCVDFIISAIGVIPNSEVFTQGNENLKVGPDGGLLVDWKMETTLPGVYAAGDVCHAGWEHAQHWHQMRLWTQARQMGMYSAKCMLASMNHETVLQDFCFEIFSHVTRLFGFKVILLGLFNGQKLGNEHELLLRMTKGKEYVKIVMKDGKMQGALLIGETDLEEMCENLILNQLDLTPFGEDLLNPHIDIEDYFD